MRQAATCVIGRQNVSESRKHLGLSCQAAKSPGVKDAGGIAGEWRAIWVAGVSVFSCHKLAVSIHRDSGRQVAIRFDRRIHPRLVVGLVIPQPRR